MGASETRCVGRRDMYKTFRVKNFRCFKDLQINDLGRVNLIAGKNNTGKTALLEAMYLLAGDIDSNAMLKKEVKYGRRLTRDSDSDWGKSATLFAVFKDFNLDSRIELSACFQKILESDDIEYSTLKMDITAVQDYALESDKLLDALFNSRYERTSDDAEVLKLNSDLDDNPLYILQTDGRLQYSQFRPKPIFLTTFLPARERVRRDDTASRFSRLQDAKGIQTLIDGLQIIEPRLEDLRLSAQDRRSEIVADIGLTNLVHMKHLGDGMTRLTDFLLAIHQIHDGAIFIDEIENGIHFSVQSKVWEAIGKLARELNIQVFATTHSLEMIRAAYDAFTVTGHLDEFRYHRLDRDREGNVEAVTYNDLDLDAVAAFDFEYEVRG